MLVCRPLGWRDPYEDVLFALRYRRPDDFRRSVCELPSVAVLDQNLDNLLHQCARLGSAESAMLLLSWPYARPDVNGRNIRGETPLHVALGALASENWILSEGVTEIILMLIDAGAQIFAQDARGVTPMNIVGRLANCPASVIRRMYLAASSVLEKSELPKVLLKNGWPVSSSFHIKSTELTLRMLELSPEIVNPNEGKKPDELLHMALRAGCPPDTLELLLTLCGLEVNANIHGQTPLHVAAMVNNGSSHYEHIKILVRAGANPNARNIYSLKPIHYTIEHGNPEVFELLLAAGSVLSGNELAHGIHFASANGHTSIIRHVLTKSNINHRCCFGMTPLLYAARDRHAAAVYYLLAAGAKVDIVDAKGWTALHHAIQGREDGSHGDVVPIIALLLHFGVDVDELNREGHTALHIALMQQDKRAIYQLVRHIALHDDDHPKPSANDVLIEKHDGLFELHKKCLQELMQLSECGIPDDANYLLLLRFIRDELIGVASGAKEVNFLRCLPEGGVEFVSSKFSAAAFPIYGNLLLSRVHHANLELMTLEEVGGLKSDSVIAEVLSLSAHEFVEFFKAKYIL